MKTFVTLCASALWALCMPASAQNAWDETTPALDLVDYQPEGWLLEDELFFFLDAGEAIGLGLTRRVSVCGSLDIVVAGLGTE